MSEGFKNTPKRKLSSNSSEPSPSTSHLHKRQQINPNMNSSSGSESSFLGAGAGADLGTRPPSLQTLQEKITSLGYANIRPSAPGAYRMSSPIYPQGPTPSFPAGIQLTPHPTHASAHDLTQRISETDIMRIATAVKDMMLAEVNNLVDAKVNTLVTCVQTLADENIKLQKKVDELEMYSRKNCVRVFGVDESKTDTDAALVEIADQIEVPLTKEDIVVSHRVGKRSEDKPRPIIARISNYEKRHQLIKESRNLRKVEGFESVSVNQELTKVRAKVAFECRKLVKEGRAKLTFVWDGKIFIVDNNDKKHLVVCINDLIMLDKLLVAKTE